MIQEINYSHTAQKKFTSIGDVLKGRVQFDNKRIEEKHKIRKDYNNDSNFFALFSKKEKTIDYTPTAAEIPRKRKRTQRSLQLNLNP